MWTLWWSESESLAVLRDPEERFTRPPWKGDSLSVRPVRASTSSSKASGKLVGTGRFELPTPRTPSECSTRLSHVPTRKEPAAVLPQRMGFNPNSLHQARGLSLPKGQPAGHRLPNPRKLHLRLRFDFLEEGLKAGCAGASSRTANWIFFSTGSTRSSSTRILCPML